MSHSADPWIPGASLAPVEPPEVGADVVGRLGTLRVQALVVMAAVPTGGLTEGIAADFAVACDQAKRSVLRLVGAPPPVVDEALRDRSRSAAYGD